MQEGPRGHWKHTGPRRQFQTEFEMELYIVVSRKEIVKPQEGARIQGRDWGLEVHGREWPMHILFGQIMGWNTGAESLGLPVKPTTYVLDPAQYLLNTRFE